MINSKNRLYFKIRPLGLGRAGAGLARHEFYPCHDLGLAALAQHSLGGSVGPARLGPLTKSKPCRAHAGLGPPTHIYTSRYSMDMVGTCHGYGKDMDFTQSSIGHETT